MNGTWDRRLISELAIGIAVCVGSWMMFVKPKLDDARRLEMEIEQARESPALKNRAEIERIATELPKIKARIGAIDEQNRFSRDSSQMYSLLTRLAKENNITMVRLDPGRSRPAGTNSTMEIASFNMRIEGRYDLVAKYLDAIEGIDGFVRPINLTVNPRGHAEDAIVEASFVCEAMSFELPPILVSMLGENDAD